ncbi:sialate O-acetylesterase [Algoriphagus vanfongensis]|uniref:sialate O-acetylesterase n=1 Tax=Algoriphagus vanfongensis TaxID=426371 RepID=UPI0004029D25|nr:sialate O-acetylesterase [Algoriphagus vanfongensis]
MKKLIPLLLLIYILVSSCQEKFESPVFLPKIISEGMVLQRDQPIKVWGKGIPGEKVRVSVAGLMSSTEVLEDSTWVIGLAATKAGGPHLMKVNQVQIQDVYFGDVWLAGGQSNMEWPLKSGVIGAEAEFESGGNPEIRFFKVPRVYAALKQDDIPEGSWKVADSTNLPDFSAVAWFFAKQNHHQKKVPVGIIESNWGGTPAEGWTDAEILAEMEGMSFQEEADDMIANQDKWNKEFLENDKRREMRDLMVQRPDSALAREVSSVSYSDAAWKRVQLPSQNPFSDIAWFRKEFTLSSTDSLSLILPYMDQMAYVYINGQQVHYKDWGTAMPELQIDSDLLFEGKNVLSVRVINTWNNRPSLGAKDEMYFLQRGRKINLEGTWAYSNQIVEPLLPEVTWQNWKPGAMYNAMIYPLKNYEVKGTIWYQGESNAGRAAEYKDLFSTMITNWRSIWELEDMPFLFVQLANYMERKEVQPESNWAALREAQRATLELPQTGMAVIIDIGEEGDIHPRNKKDVGERLWRLAQNVAFGENVIASGPQIKEVAQNGASLQLTFDSVGDGLELVVGGEALAFTVKNQSGRWIAVKGELEGKDQIKIKCPDGFEPVEVRYAWADNPEVNLINSEGLPAQPFQWELK